MTGTRVEKYITFGPASLSPAKKTKRIMVYSLRPPEISLIVGIIRWHGAWRKYCYFPTDGTFYDQDCMALIANKLTDLNKAHFKKT